MWASLPLDLGKPGGRSHGGLFGAYLGVALSLLVVICGLTAARSAAASEHDRLSALVWVRNEGDVALVERVRGQVSDLDIELVVKHTKSAHPPIPSNPGVFAVVWFARPNPMVDRIVVHVSGTGDEPNRELVREVGTGARTGDVESATLEAAALVVRAALRELAANNPSPPSAADDDSSTQETEELSHPKRSGLFADAGWLLVLDGVDPGYNTGPELRLGASFGSFNVSGLATTSIPVSVQDEYGTMRLHRHTFAVRSGYELWLSPVISLDLAVALGAALYDRKVETIEPEVSGAEDGVSSSLLVGPELRLAWRLGRIPVDLGFTAALYVVPSAPQIGYEIDDNFISSVEVWRLQPSFGVSMRVKTSGFW